MNFTLLRGDYMFRRAIQSIRERVEFYTRRSERRRVSAETGKMEAVQEEKTKW